ncbi:MAG: hypothetical protein Q7J78_06265, partial [Clostridiales bacterium]|nr:hypothetical protein [Clostridiales bacterium]
MQKLTELIQHEVAKNHHLKKALEEGVFPSAEVAAEIGAEQLFRLASNKASFDVGVRLEIIRSDSYLAGLVDAYLADSATDQRSN